MSQNRSSFSKITGAQITGCGHAFPSRIVTNDELSKSLDTSDEWIRTRTGISQRRIASEEETTATLGADAAKIALERAGVRACDVEAIILATTTPDHPMPATATKIQALLEARKAFAFDVQAVCCGFINALAVADQFIKSGFIRNALVIGADVMSRILDWTDRSTCVLFGDGAGAVFLQETEDCDHRVLSTHLYSDGNFYDKLFVEDQEEDQKLPKGVRGFLKMDGRAVFSAALEKMEMSAKQALQANDLTIQDIDVFVAHQANKRIIDAVAERLGLSSEKVIITVDQFANTCAATIPSTLSLAVDQKKIQKGQRVLLSAIGGGFAWGSAVIQW